MGFFFKKKTLSNLENIPSDTTPARPTISNTQINDILDNCYFFPLIKNDDYIFGTLPSPDEPVFSIILYIKSTNQFIKKSWEHLPGQSIGCSKYAISTNGWFAFTIDIYYRSESLHSERYLYLCDPSGKEFWRINYKSYGARNYKFSSSGRYFILLNHDSIYVHDTFKQCLFTFYPEDIGNSSSLDFDILEDQKLIAYKYTNHPDTPIYHFTFDGELLENDLFKEQVEKLNMPTQKEQELQKLYAEISEAKHPISENDYKTFSESLLHFSEDPYFSECAYIFRSLGELELEMENKKEALKYFDKALEIDPNVGIKRVASKLRKELS